MNYYYLIATLPDVSLDAPPPIPSDSFKTLCAEHLSPADLKALDKLLDPESTKCRNGFVDEWEDFETQLRNTIARNRASQLKRDADEFMKQAKGFDGLIEKTVTDAFAKQNPLEREQALDKFRWDRVEELAEFDPFATRAVLAYTLKLLLAERWAKMDQELGSKNADDIISNKPEDKEQEEEKE